MHLLHQPDVRLARSAVRLPALVALAHARIDEENKKFAGGGAADKDKAAKSAAELKKAWSDVKQDEVRLLRFWLDSLDFARLLACCCTNRRCPTSGLRSN